MRSILDDVNDVQFVFEVVDSGGHKVGVLVVDGDSAQDRGQVGGGFSLARQVAVDGDKLVVFHVRFPFLYLTGLL